MKKWTMRSTDNSEISYKIFCSRNIIKNSKEVRQHSRHLVIDKVY